MSCVANDETISINQSKNERVADALYLKNFFKGVCVKLSSALVISAVNKVFEQNAANGIAGMLFGYVAKPALGYAARFVVSHTSDWILDYMSPHINKLENWAKEGLEVALKAEGDFIEGAVAGNDTYSLEISDNEGLYSPIPDLLVNYELINFLA